MTPKCRGHYKGYELGLFDLCQVHRRICLDGKPILKRATVQPIRAALPTCALPKNEGVAWVNGWLGAKSEQRQGIQISWLESSTKASKIRLPLPDKKKKPGGFEGLSPQPSGQAVAPVSASSKTETFSGNNAQKGGEIVAALWHRWTSCRRRETVMESGQIQRKLVVASAAPWKHVVGCKDWCGLNYGMRHNRNRLPPCL